MEVLKENKNLIDVENIKELFWNMFVIDSIIGNTDRYNGNWGFIQKRETKKIFFSPIYDCGSCLNPLLEDGQLENIDKVELENLAINYYSCLKENGKMINYMTYIKQMKNDECNKAIVRMFCKIDIEKIENFIDSIECIAKSRKEFYKEVINIRYNIIKDVYNILQN